MAVCLLFSCREYRHCCYCHSCCNIYCCSNCQCWCVHLPKVKVSSFTLIGPLTIKAKPKTSYCWMLDYKNEETYCT